MFCLMRCGGCRIDGSKEADAAFEKALDEPIPAECPQMYYGIPDSVAAAPVSASDQQAPPALQVK